MRGEFEEVKEVPVGWTPGLYIAIQKLLDRAKSRQLSLRLTPLPKGDGGGWVAALGDTQTRPTNTYEQAVVDLADITV